MNQQRVDNSKDLTTVRLFDATHWSVVLRAKDDSVTTLNTLFGSYRKPLLALARIKGNAPQDAEDIVHGFLEQLCKRRFLENIGPQNGKFRTFLRKSFAYYLVDLHDKAIAAKRGGGVITESLQETDADGVPIHEPVAENSGADIEFDRAWARAILANALHCLEEECVRAGHGRLWSEIEPVLYQDQTSDSYLEIGERLGMSAGAVKTATHRIRARLKGLIHEEISQTVTNQEDCEEELGYLRMP